MMLPRSYPKLTKFLLSRLHSCIDARVRKCIPDKALHRYSSTCVCPLSVMVHWKNSPAVPHSRTSPCQGTCAKSSLYLLLKWCPFVKAILATQFDAFDKGRWHESHLVENPLINCILRAYVVLQLQVIAGRRRLQCWWCVSLFNTHNTSLSDQDWPGEMWKWVHIPVTLWKF